MSGSYFIPAVYFIFLSNESIVRLPLVFKYTAEHVLWLSGVKALPRGAHQGSILPFLEMLNHLPLRVSTTSDQAFLWNILLSDSCRYDEVACLLRVEVPDLLY